MGHGAFLSVPARFAGFQAFENRFLFPGDGEVSDEKPLDHRDGRGGHQCTSFRLVRIQSMNTSGETKKPPSPVKGRAVSARGTTPLRHSLSVCDLTLCNGVVSCVPYTVARVTESRVRRRLLRTGSILFGTKLGGLFRRHFRYRFSAPAALCSVSVGYSSSSTLIEFECQLLL